MTQQQSLWTDERIEKEVDDLTYGWEVDLDAVVALMKTIRDEVAAANGGHDCAATRRQPSAADRRRTMTQQDFELLPCPFCGKQADLLDVGIRPDIGYIVRCTECDGQAGDTDEGWIQAGDAIKAWNRRAQPPAPVSRVTVADEIAQTIRYSLLRMRTAADFDGRSADVERLNNALAWLKQQEVTR